MDGREECLRPVLHPLDRQAEPLGYGGGHVVLAVDVDLGAKAAADLRSDSPHLVLAQSGQRSDMGAQDVRVLRRRPDGQRLLARFEVRDDAARLDRGRRQPLVDHALRYHDVRIGEGPVNGAVVDPTARADAGTGRQRPDRPVVREVGVQHRRLTAQRLLGIDHRRQRLVVDRNGVCRVARHIAVTRHDDGDGVADVAHHVRGDRAMLRRGKRRRDRHRAEELGELRAGEHRLDAVERLRGARVDGQDAAVRDVAASERQVLQAGDLDVVDVGAAALDEPWILAPPHALADELGQDCRRCHGLPARVRSAACCTALTMCW